MSQGFAVPPDAAGQPPARVRPTIVTIADALLIVVAVLYAIGFVMGLSIIGTMNEILQEEFAGTELEGTEGIVAAVMVGGSFVNLLIAGGLVALAILNNKGKNPARIVTWVVGGIGLCCSGLGLLGGGMNSASFGGTDTGEIDQARLEQRLTDALPSWYEPLNLTILVVSVLALAAALLLLALPPSNEFFRKPPPQQFEPPPPAYPPVG